MAWKNFQNGYPLYASELNNYLMNQAVVVFASAADRAATLTSPVEGMVTWLQDTNVFQVYNGTAWTDINDNTDAIQKTLLTTAGDTIYATGSATPARLGIGATGALLKSTGTAPAWLGVGTSGQVLSSTGSDLAWTTVASGGMTLLSTTTLSGTSTTISSIPGGYKTLALLVTGVYSSAYTPMYVKPNDTGAYTSQRASSTPFTVGEVGNGSLYTNSTGTVQDIIYNSGTSNALNFYYEINNYSVDGAHPIKFYGRSNIATIWGNGSSLPTGTAITSVVFNTNGTATFTDGTVKLYGVN